jgi:hypothetical protein
MALFDHVAQENVAAACLVMLKQTCMWPQEEGKETGGDVEQRRM